MDRYHPVKTGDTPKKIAEELGVDVEELLEIKHEGGPTNREHLANHLNLVAGADGKNEDSRGRIIPQLRADEVGPATQLVEGVALLLGESKGKGK